LGDILKYRIPGQDPVFQQGVFQVLTDLNQAKGFLVSSFEGNKIYCFGKTSVLGNYSFIEKAPFVISKEAYIEQGSTFIGQLNKQQIEKAILSRIKAVDFDSEYSETLYKNLCTAYPKAFVYLISSSLFGTWIGASPEVLIEGTAKSATTMALAGTKKVSQLEEAWGEKEVVEQRLVTDYLLQRLESLGINDIHKEGPVDEIAGPVVHLKTTLRFDLKKNSLFDVAKLVHPTPAVSGFPPGRALELIHKTESHERDLYAGMIGVVGKNGANLYVNLRCCQVQKNRLYLYVGGGYTTDSIAELEWQETENKSRTILDNLG
jgi:isochorismate synthase